MIRHLGSSSSPDSVLTKKIVIQKSSGGTDSFWLWMGCGNDVGTQKWEGTVHMAVIRALTGFSVEWVQSVGYNWPIYRTHLLWYSLLTLQKSRNTGQVFRKETTTLICTGMLVLFLHLPHHDLLQCGAKWPLAVRSGMVWCFIYCCSLPSFGAVLQISRSLTPCSF